METTSPGPQVGVEASQPSQSWEEKPNPSALGKRPRQGALNKGPVSLAHTLLITGETWQLAGQPTPYHNSQEVVEAHKPQSTKEHTVSLSLENTICCSSSRSNIDSVDDGPNQFSL